MGKNIYNNIIKKWLVYRINKELLHIRMENASSSIEKHSKDLNRHFTKLKPQMADDSRGDVWSHW